MSTSHRRLPARTQSQTLWDGENGQTCPVFPVYRHPVFRRLKRLCYGWMPGLFFLALLFGRLDLVAWLFLLYLGFLLGVVVLLLIATQHGQLSGGVRTLWRLAKGWRFLCPACLRLGPERFACGSCGEEVEEFVLHTHGLYVNDCPACRTPVFTGEEHSARARCAHCGTRCDARHHERRVRLFGVLGHASLRQLRHWPLLLQSSAEGAYLRADDGRQFTCVVDVADPRGHETPFPAEHAARSLEALWFGEEWPDPLAFAQALDRFIRRAQLSPAAQASLPVWVRDGHWSPAARNVLEARFPNVEYAVSVETFLARSLGVATVPARVFSQPR